MQKKGKLPIEALIKTMNKYIYGAISIILILFAVMTSGQAANERTCGIWGSTCTSNTVASDEKIRDIIMRRMRGQFRCPCDSINVNVCNGHVTLTGEIGDSMKVPMATVIASSVVGVCCVENKICLSKIAARDSEIEKLVRDRIGRTFIRNYQGINVVSRSGVVELTGSVESDLDLETAGQVAAAVPGVVDVFNYLSVSTSSDLN